MTRWCATILGASLCVAMAVLPTVRADDWPQFRGPNCSGIASSAKPLPVTFSATENVRWSANVGDGVGGAVVAAGRVFVSGMTAEETVALFAFDAATGRKLWQRDWPTGPLAEVHATNSQASATPAADANRVYFYFSTLGLVAVDAQTGKDVWHKKLPTPFFVFKWGAGMSPVVYRDMVLFCQDDDLNPAIWAFDKATGQERWRDDRLDMAVNYSQPVICTTDGRDEIVVAGTGMLIGYDPQTGKRRWFAKNLLRNIKTTPVVQDGVIYISVQSGAIANQWLASVDRDAKAGNNDNRLDKAEIQRFVGKQPIPEAFFKKTFDRGDLNKDGFLEGRELDVAFLHPDNFAGGDFSAVGDAAAEQFILAVRGGGEGDVTKTHLVWKHKTKNTDHIVSPFVSGGRMFLVKEGGISTVFGLERGEPMRAAKRVGQGGGYFASPVSGDGKIYLASDNGRVTVLKNDATYEELAVNDVGESIIATPAIADGQLFVRSRTKLTSFGLPTDKHRAVAGVEYLYETASFPQCHAATIAETPSGLVAAWFGGSAEGRPDVGIWFARRSGSGWTKPVEVATGAAGVNGAKPQPSKLSKNEAKPSSGENPAGADKRYPCWNPVLFQFPNGPLALYYKVGPSPSSWWGMAIESIDGGATWSAPRRLPDEIAGPIKNKPVLLADGRLVCGSSTEDQGWRVHIETTSDLGKTWQRTGVLNDGKEFGAIQPTILRTGDHGLTILCRARGVGKVLAASSTDDGRTWSPLAPINLPNPNSGIDGVTLRDGRHLLVYNHTPKGRSPLNVAVSQDGREWQQVVELETEPGEYSYPAVIQAADGRVHILYTWRRQRIRHVTLDPSQLATQ